MISGYDDWKLMSPDEEAERIFGPQEEEEEEEEEEEPDDDPDLDDEYEEALANCSQFVADGHIHCGAIGSEQCDECPFHDDIGTKAPREGGESK